MQVMLESRDHKTREAVVTIMKSQEAVVTIMKSQEAVVTIMKSQTLSDNDRALSSHFLWSVYKETA